VSTDLSWFELMVPCGIAGVSMTSIERETGESLPLEVVADRVISSFSEVFDVTAQRIDASVLSPVPVTR